jgi:hypothetical protein
MCQIKFLNALHCTKNWSVTRKYAASILLTSHSRIFLWWDFCLFCVTRAIFQVSARRLSPLPVTGLHLALTVFSSEGSFTCYTYFDTGPPVLIKLIFENPMIPTFECHARGEGVITTYLKRLRYDVAGTDGAWTYNLPNAVRKHYHQTTTNTKACLQDCWKFKDMILMKRNIWKPSENNAKKFW